MKMNINIPVHSQKMRVLSAFMAFLVFALTFQEAFVGWSGTRVKAATTGPNIYFNTDTTDNSTTGIKDLVSNGFTYTGALKTSKVTMFDYVSDAEFVTGADYSYNNFTHYVPWGGYDDAYTAFNHAIASDHASTNYTKSSSSNSTTIKFKSTNNKCTRAYVHFWSTTSIDTAWPGIPMTFNPSDNCFYLTVPNSYLGTSAKAKINGGKNDTGGDTWQSAEFSITDRGKEYYWEWDESDRFAGDTSYNYATTAGGTPWSDGNTDAESIYYTKYANPLYFGCFYYDDTATTYSSTKYPKNYYDNFWWRANIGLKPENTNNRGNVAVQGLVDGVLRVKNNTSAAATNFDKTGVLTQTNGTVAYELPYFNTSWADSHSDVMKYYNKSGATDHTGEDIYFPFYEVVTPTTGSSVSSSVKHLNGSGSFADGEYARFYQFVAKDTNVHFVVSDADNHKGYFEEKSKDDKIKSNLNYLGGDHTGFFPFNECGDNHSYDSKKNNLGFGARYDLTFELQSDGCVGVTDATGADLVNDGTSHTGRIHTIFEFTGDDDLWVFVDGKLVLDMGGSHSQSTGIIDFAAGTSTVTYKKALGSTDSEKDNLGVDPDSTTAVDITSLIDGCTVSEGKHTYDGTIHTMTIFYMERGMNDSNLMIRYNYSPMSNFSKMKVQEYTDFSNVNAGLLTKTMEAADYDVFEYTVQNKGTVSTDPKLSSAVYPTTAEHIRTNPGNSSKTTKLTPDSGDSPSAAKFNPADETEWLPVINTTYLWVDAYAGMNSTSKGGTGKGAGKTDGTYGKLYLMYGTDENTDLGIDAKESSAEFEAQFTEKTSYMRIKQGAVLTSPHVPNGSSYTSLKGTNVRADATHPTINVSDYYTLSSVKLRSISQVGYTDLTSDYNNTTTYPNGAEFQFKNDTNVDDSVNTMLTEYFTNTVNVGAISVTKSVNAGVSGASEASNTDSFTFTLTLTDVFGVANVNVEDYSGIKYTITGDANTHTLNADGTFTLTMGQTATISGIPVGTKYTITEVPNTNYSSSGGQATATQIANGTLTSNGSTQTYEPSSRSYTVTNTRRVGNLVLEKNLDANAAGNGITVSTPFTFKVTLTPPSSISLSDFKTYLGSDAASYTTVDNTLEREFTVTDTTGATITGLPYGTAYSVTETTTSPSTGHTDENTSGTINSGSVTATITNNYPQITEIPVTVTKSGESGDDMSGAEFELWYKETVPPKTNSFNEPKLAPNQLNNMKVTATPAEVGVPGLEVPASVTNYTVTTTYTNPEVPDVTDKDWILPRNDTDYIYFRDFNDGTPGEWDSVTFRTSIGSASDLNPEQKRSWRDAYFKSDNTYGQNQTLELGYNESQWMAAEFSGNGKQTVRYAVWERFVDEYKLGTTDWTTVIWKIQPPDGYTDVRFMLMQGDTVIRKTVKFKYELGKIYHKTSWGGYWCKQNGIDSYYDVPIKAEVNADTGNGNYWAPDGAATGTINDQRMSGEPYIDSAEVTYTRQMLQARKYEPTAQKVIFHCNSTNVWHNIHIEFFVQNDASGAIEEDSHKYDRVNGQAFPGYMMEPFAYAGNNYRMDDGYLTYELTIPATATHFRINNGEETGTYAYKSAITALNHVTTEKNYGNYWKIGTQDYAHNSVTLTKWTDPQKEEGGVTGTIPSADYKNVEVTSDYDYIYFEQPASGWGNSIYAYFYAGGDLRGDNWQRACYSSWPGVAAAGTEYGTVHSNTYTYPTLGSEYNGTTPSAADTLSPEATYTVGSGQNAKTIYKFRIPKGDRTNYSKVIFNDGLTVQGGSHETGVIDYQPGHLYDKDGNATMHYENSPTKAYTAKTIGTGSNVTTEYIYVKNTAGWDDLHITFYDANGGQILQGGKGYVMDYAGSLSSANYFKIPIPTEAVKFSVNNGMGSDNAAKVSPKVDIIRLGADGKTKAESQKLDTDRFVYELTNTSGVELTRLGITTTSVAQTARPTQQEEGFTDYTEKTPETTPPTYEIRQSNDSDDTLNIRDMANWNVDIGRMSVTFYKADGTQIGPNVMVKTVADAQGKRWYTKKIHPDAKSFTISYSTASDDNPPTYTTPKYPIYSNTVSTTDDYTTSGSMFFDTAGAEANSTLVMTHAEPVLSDNAVNDETYSQRGDYLYLIYTTKPTNPTVTFYASGDNVIKSGIKAKYINQQGTTPNVEYWYKVSIPTGAQAFWATGMTEGDKKDIYELRSKVSPYKKNYTLGDMQYKITGSTATLLYPVFTEDAVNSLDVYTDGGTTHSIYSQIAVLVDDSKVATYAGQPAATLPTAETTDYSVPTTQVLYNTSADDVTYTWTEGTPNDDLLRFVKPSGWSSTITAEFYNGSDTTPVTSTTMTSGSPYTVTVPDTSTYTYDKVLFKDSGSNKTSKIDLLGDHGKNYICQQTTSNSYSVGSDKVGFDNTQIGWSTVYAHFWSDSNTPTTWPGTQMTNNGGIWTVDIPAGSTYVIFDNGLDSSKHTKSKTLDLSLTGNNGKVFHPRVSDKLLVKCGDVNSNYGDANAGERNALFWTGSNSATVTGNSWDREYNGLTGNSKYGDSFSVPADSYANVKVYRGTDPSNSAKYTWASYSLTLNADNNYGRGQVYKLTRTGNRANWEYLGIGHQDYADSGYWDNTATTWSLTAYSSGTGQTTYTYAYQPEDRYGMISDQNTTAGSEGVLGRADADDFIKVTIPDTNTIAKPYIKFYNGNTYIGTVASPPQNVTSSAKGLRLDGTSMELNGTTYSLELSKDTVNGTVTYMVRLPKNATKFQILDDTDVKYTQLIDETSTDTTGVQVNIGTAQNPQMIIVPGTYRHAGTTFDFTGASVTTTLRTGFTPYKQTMVDPLEPMTDYDFIYFTDTDGTFANDGKVFAYFYGGADGEYKAWPGSYATTTNDLSFYKDNNGKTVYQFRVPKGTDGVYTKVIFNNGQSGNALKITAAQDIVGGMNYTLGDVTNQDYGSMTSADTVYAVTTNAKTTTPTANYAASANKTIYFINNGTMCEATTETDKTGGRYLLDDIHVEFFAADGSTPVGNADPGYIPQKVGAYSEGDISGTVYRITAPNNAQYFRINNGNGKGAVTSTHNHDRKSEIKLLTNNGLYSFVTDPTNYTKDGTKPTTITALSQPEYLLQLVNPRTIIDDDDQPDPEYYDVKLATVRTGTDGNISTILWLKDDLNNIDSTYLANTSATLPVKVKKNGTYYWKEVTPPSGYKLPDQVKQEFTVPAQATASFTDPVIEKGTLTLSKKLYSVSNDTPVDNEKTQLFTFTIELNAPVGTRWNTTAFADSVALSPSGTTGTIVSDDRETTTSLTRTVVVKLPANGTDFVTISKLPYGTTYSVTETSPNGYTAEPIIIYKPANQTTTVDEVAGEISSSDSAPSYLLTNKHEVGSLNLKDIVNGTDEALQHANVNQPEDHDPAYDPPVYDWYKYDYEVTLIAPEGIDLDDYISTDALNAVTGINTQDNVVYTARTTGVRSQYKFHIYVTSAPDGMKTISNIPLGTRYIVTEVDPENTHTPYKERVTWYKEDEVPESAPPQYVNAEHRSPTVTIVNNYSYSPITTRDISLNKTRAVTDNSVLPTLTPSGQTQVAGTDYFVYSVTLKAPGTALWSNYRDVTGIPDGTAKNFNEITFNVNVTPDTATIIGNVPIGAEYSVSEPSNSNPTPAGYKCVTSAGVSNVEVTASSDTSVTITNTYTQLGSLSLTKTKVDTGNISSQTQFDMTVVLTPPGTMTATELQAYSSALDSFTPDESATPNTLTGTVSVSSFGSATTLSNIPYGTKVAVAEADTSQNMTSKVEYSIDSGANYSTTSVTDLAVDGDESVFVRNTYPELGNLKITKTIEATEGEAPTGQAFVFEVELTPQANTVVDLSDFTITLDNSATGVSMLEQTVTAGVMTFTVTITGAGSATIKGIPTGTQYFVKEQALAATPQWSLESPSANNYNGSVATTPTELTFNNLYTPTIDKALVLFKQDATTNAGIPGAFFYLLKLNDGVDITNAAVMDAFAHNRIEDILNASTGYATKVLEDTTDSNGYISVPGTSIDFHEGKRYFFYEVQPGVTELENEVYIHYLNDNTLSPSKVITINADQLVYTVTNRNYREITPTGTEVFKTNDNNEPLPGAELDLYFRENKTPSTYLSNSKYYVPDALRTTLVNKSLTVPDVPNAETYKTYTYTYQYQDMPVPSAQDYDWIQPRTDNDYIYFRDYTQGTTAMWDNRSFNDNQYLGDEEKAQNDKRSWLWTGFEQNTYKQEKEIEYDHSYWYMAVFSGHPTKSDKPEYGVWERFVDRYENQDTVVWKIQPPDGYTKVRFLLYHEYKDGNVTYKKCVRSTKEITFKLGEIYHRKNFGTWRYQYGHECYFDVDTVDEGTWSTYKTTQHNSQTGQADKRQSGENTNSIDQADRYTPTQQKIVFHCNSDTVWHNIHIEFFTDENNGSTHTATQTGDTKTYYAVGQTAPGYLMEPYAYADKATYRINGFLTYELTIPDGAKYFRVNNGVVGTNQYQYSSKITMLKTDTTRKNYGNYFSINGQSGKQAVTANSPVTLKSWNAYTNYGDKWNETYSTLEVESDYDYIYFEKPADWSDHVYAYFYAGNDLREDNYNRATYSAWPGVAAVSTEYVEKDKDGNVVETYHSDQYTYTYQQNNSTGQLYTSSADGEALNPETIFNRAASNGDTVTAVYKFRLPKSELKSYANGEKRNYDKVIFNDGLYAERDTGVSKTHETKAITFKAGAQYDQNRTETKRYSSTATVGYTKRGDGDDYIYIRTTDTTNWDDIHIKFYNANGERILQSGSGYVMEYAGKQKVDETTYTYFRAAIPANAAKFKLNNGKYKSGDHEKETGFYDILRLDPDADNTVSGYTKDRLVYLLKDDALTLKSPNITPNPPETVTVTSGEQNNNVNYTARNNSDMLYIRDTAAWNIPLNGGIVNFYDSNGNAAGSADTYSLIKTKIETTAEATANGRTSPAVWYKIPIHEDAASFTITYNGNTTDRYDIYPIGTASSDSGTYTTGNMYYETQGGGVLAVMNNTISEVNNYQTPTYVTSNKTRDGQGGDYLYLVCTDKTKWQDMTVTFKSGTTTIQSDVPAQYLNYVGFAPAGVEPVAGETTSDTNAVGYWYRVAIPQYSSDKPKGAMEFTVTGSDGTNSTTTTDAAIYELVAKASVYKKDYTLGDMQYRLPDSGNKPTLLYPVFTEVEPAEYELGGQSVTTTSLTPVDESQIEPYVDATAATMLAGSGDAANTLPVLYQTSNGTVTYKWGTANAKIYFDNSNTSWNSVYAYINGESRQMTKPSGETYYQLDLTGITVSGNVSFRNNTSGTVQTGSKTLTAGKLYTPDLKSNDNILYLDANGHNNSNNNIYAKFDSSNDEKNGETLNDAPTGYTWGSNSRKWYLDNGNGHAGDGHSTVSFKINGGDYTTVATLKNQGHGEVWRLSNANNRWFAEFVGYVKSDNSVGTSSDGKIPLKNPTDPTGVSGGSATVSYQPEDRYGMISDQNSTSTPAVAGTADENNFIYISTSSTLTEPYIHFYATNDGTGTEIGTFEPSTTTTGISLKYTAVMNGTNEVSVSSGDGTTANPYKIRLPKNASSFKITGKSGNNTVTSAVQPLYQENVTVTRTVTIDEVNYTQTDTLSGTYHHAGTTFNYDCADGNALTVASLRSGYTPNRATDMTDPLNPRSDADYVFFTDTDDTIGGAGGTVYAYFYGGADGEFNAWPGIAASATLDPSIAHPTEATAYSTYKDNLDRTVYMFRIPQGEEGTYPYVIFTNGMNTGRLTTQAGAIGSGGKNFILDTTEANRQDYGSFSSAYALRTEARTNQTIGSAYSTAGTNRYIYIVNNGTQNLKAGEIVDQSSCYILDDIHVEFFDGDNRPVIQGSNGTSYSGLKPDKLNKGYTISGTTYDVYRIQVPNGARYFRINNGEKDVVGETSTQHNERQSEMKAITANGLYSFVQGESDASKYIQSGEDIPADDGAARETPHYLLTLVNEIQTDEDIPETGTKDIKLATVVTKNQQNNAKGNIDHISWLKLNDEGTQVDRDYLYHTLDDLNNTTVTQVNVVKDGTYYWVEQVAPSDYVKSDEQHIFVVENGVVKVYNESGTLTATDPSNTVKVVNEPVDHQTEVILTKTAKEQVGKTNIGDILAGAKFKLVAADGTAYKFTKTATDPDGAIEGKKTHEYTVNNASGTYNVESTNSWLETGEDGRLHIKGLPIGDYYLEEQEAPTGFSAYDSNDVVNGTAQKRKVTFSVGVNTTVKEITAADEMEPAYIKLYEHINEKRSEWGDPTFIFKITQTGYYKNDGTTDIQTVSNGKEMLVALTVDDNGIYTAGLVSHDDPAYNYQQWYEEGTDEIEQAVREYEGLFKIDSQGRIRVEPGTYEITRLPVSRYEFVENTWKLASEIDGDKTEAEIFADHRTSVEKLSVTIPAKETALVHYYDKVEYYDKFTQVDEKINQFHRYTDDDNGRQKTVKGIRVEDYHQVGTTAESPATPDTVNNVLTVPLKNLVVYKVLVDGTEQAMTADEKAHLTVTYTPKENDLAGFNDETTGFQFGNSASNNPAIIVSYASNYNQGVYTLTANDDGYQAAFDIVFVRDETPTNLTPPAAEP